MRAWHDRSVAPWRLTVRSGPRVERTGFDSLGAALDAMAQRMQELAPDARRPAVEMLRRRFEPARQVAVRAEVSGPRGVRGGVDLRGDGSIEAFVGRWRRRLIDEQAGEGVYAGLRRSLGGAPPKM